uniref:Uncharacterized protein n=1 Tax=Arundo donax TaxID=35708 RepID=A0A0A9PST6_ARUDO
MSLTCYVSIIQSNSYLSPTTSVHIFPPFLTISKSVWPSAISYLTVTFFPFPASSCSFLTSTIQNQKHYLDSQPHSHHGMAQFLVILS